MLCYEYNDQAGRIVRPGIKEIDNGVLLINLYPNSLLLTFDLLISNNQQQGRACSLSRNIFSLTTKYPNIFSFICHTKCLPRTKTRNVQNPHFNGLYFSVIIDHND